MLLSPKYPQTSTAPTLPVHAPTTPVCACQQLRSVAWARRVAPTLGVVAGAVTAVVAVGVVLTALLVAVTVAAVSVAVVAVVLRSLLAPPHRR